MEAIITSRTRREILSLLFHDPTTAHYLRDIVRKTGREVNAVKRELDLLTQAHVVTREERAHKIFFQANTGWMYFEDMCRCMAHTIQIVHMLRTRHTQLGVISFISLSMKYITRKPLRTDEIHVLVVGTIAERELTAIIHECQKTYGTEIHYSILSVEEFAYRKKQNDPFVWNHLKKPKIMIAGSEESFVQ